MTPDKILAEMEESRDQIVSSTIDERMRIHRILTRHIDHMREWFKEQEEEWKRLQFYRAVAVKIMQDAQRTNNRPLYIPFAADLEAAKRTGSGQETGPNK